MSAAVRRAWVLTSLAALAYGGWAVAVNWPHGSAVALRVGAVQGASSATTTLVMSAVVEGLYAAWSGRALRRVVAWLVPALLGGGLHLAVHLANGTPEVIATIAPSVLLGAVFTGTYVLGLARADVAGR